ncbi:MAG: hypothetical protein WBX25_36895 [Rhodomicrobium sp.]
MRKIAIAAILALVPAASMAAVTCQEQASAKKLAGAALNSFMTKCQKQASANCQKASAEKKLSGAAKSSFETRCMKDAVGKS